MRAIQADAVAILQSLGRLVDAHHGRYAILAGHNRAVGHHPAHLHDQPASRHEQGRPGRVGSGADQNLTLGDLSAGRVEHHPHRALDHAR